METSEKVTVTKTIINDGKPFYVSGKKYFVYKSRVYRFWMRFFPLDKIFTETLEVEYFNRSIRFYPINLGHHILFCDEPFPCFDSSDYEYDNRYYHAFFSVLPGQTLKENMII
jgi:hypothetical protein